jgi:hypothetical protein
LQLWLKGDAGVENGGTAATPGQNIDAWRDQSGNSQDATQLTVNNQPTFRSDETNNINSNPVVDFKDTAGDGVGDRMDFTSDLGLNGTNLFSIMAVFRLESDTGIDTILGSDAAVPTEFSYYIWNGDNKLFVDARGIGQLSTNSTFTADQIAMTALTRAGSNTFSHYVTGALDSSGAIGGSFSGSFNTGNIDLGDRGGVPFDGEMAEIIIYSDDKGAQPTDLQKIHSYLALKYGMTLDSSVSYLDSSGTIIWNATSNSAYHNDVAAIGVDDGSVLSQLTSRSVNDDSIVTITGTVANIISGEFLIWGNDNGALTASTEVPAGYSQRFLREWNVAETGDVGNVSISFDLTGLGGIDLANTAGFALLVDSDGDFSDATATAGGTVSGNQVSFTGVDLSDGQYFSLAYPN